MCGIHSNCNGFRCEDTFFWNVSTERPEEKSASRQAYFLSALCIVGDSFHTGELIPQQISNDL